MVDPETFLTPDDALPDNPILRTRSAQVEAQLAAWASRTPSLQFDAKGSHLFSMMELAYSYPKRAHEIANVIRLLLERSHIVPAVIMARALTETVAAGTLYLADMVRLVASGDLNRLEARFMKFYSGIRDHDIGPVHVLDAIRHLEKIDEAYFEDLSMRYPLLDEIKKRIINATEEQGASSEFTLPLVSRNYALLSEVAHPNGLGTQFLYPAPDTPYDGKSLRQRLSFLCEAAIWQAHHLITALGRAETLPEEFRVKFLTMEP
jgi:hypothetical protein